MQFTHDSYLKLLTQLPENKPLFFNTLALVQFHNVKLKLTPDSAASGLKHINLIIFLFAFGIIYLRMKK